MARLPPPPSVGRGSQSSESTADEDAARDAAAAQLPSSVVELPDAWLLDAEAAAAPALPDLPTFDDAPNVDPLVGISVTPAAATPIEPPAPEPEVAAVAAPPVPEVAVVAPTRASELPPTTPAPRAVAKAPSDSNRRTMLAAGGVLGAVLVVVMIMRCGSNDSETKPAPGKVAVAPARMFDGDTATPNTPPPAGDDGGAAAGDAAANAGAAGGTQPSQAEANQADANQVGANAAGENGGEGDQPDGEEAAVQPDAKAQDAPAAADVDAKDDEPIAVDDRDATPASTSSKSSSRTDHVSPSKPNPDANLTAAENLEKARAAWKAGNAKDTYKYANKSRFKEPTDEATELATLAACKMKLDEAAKSSYKQLDGDRKKRTRTACRDFGVRVGL
jgi:hypothetical protein